MEYETILYEEADDHVATITLNRPAAYNSFNQRMREEFADVWKRVRLTDSIHAVFLKAAGDKAFSTGVDVKEGIDRPKNKLSEHDPSVELGPKNNGVWKPVVCAVHGLCAAGAFYWVNEADIVIASEDAQFFDPHVSYGTVTALEPIGMTAKVPLGQVLRIALTGLDERVTAQTAMTIGLVSEVVPREELHPHARKLAAEIAAKPPGGVQGTVKAIWESLDVGRSIAMQRGIVYPQIGSPLGIRAMDRKTTPRPTPRLR
ncbi:MAG TPA: enoyl-CoA hydratase/isomerase family protein [Amycolatopsis sp.]|nr:enoyl-CoA hydratase/isomerase family protein [Amycolatopsis sp.]